MARVTLVVALILAFIAEVGGFFIVISTGYSSGSIVIQSEKAGQFQVGLALLIVGAAGLAFWVGFTL